MSWELFSYRPHHVLECSLVPDASLGLLGDLGHGLDADHGVVSLGSLPAQHHAVRAVQDRVGHVARLGAGGARLLHHGLEHLRGADHGLAEPVALRDHLLLGDEDLLGGDLDTHIAPGHHGALASLDDLGQVLDSLLILDLGDDPDVLALLAEDVFDLLDPVRVPDEGGEDHVDPLLHSEQQVRLILLRDGGQVGVRARQVAALPRPQVALILHGSDEVIVGDLLAHDGDEAVVDEEPLAGGDDLADVLVVDPETLGRALLLLLVVSGDLDGGARLQCQLNARSSFWRRSSRSR